MQHLGSTRRHLREGSSVTWQNGVHFRNHLIHISSSGTEHLRIFDDEESLLHMHECNLVMCTGAVPATCTASAIKNRPQKL